MLDFNLDLIKIKWKTILLLKFAKEEEWVKNSVNILPHVIILIKLLFLYATSGRVPIASFAAVNSALVKITSAGLGLVFFY